MLIIHFHNAAKLNDRRTKIDNKFRFAKEFSKFPKGTNNGSRTS